MLLLSDSYKLLQSGALHLSLAKSICYITPIVLPVLVDPVLTDSPHVRFLCCISSKLIRLPPHPPPLLTQPFAPGSLVLLSPPQVAVRRASKAGRCQCEEDHL